jgi:hypothetical protein
MKLTDKLSQMKEQFKTEEKSFRPDDSRVIIAEMQINAIREMANDTNGVFSQLDMSEVFDVSRAYVFAANPLPSVTERMSARKISFQFKLPFLTYFLDENIKHRHKIDRKRVQEYIEGLKAVAPKQQMMMSDDPQKRGILGRMI